MNNRPEDPRDKIIYALIQNSMYPKTQDINPHEEKLNLSDYNFARLKRGDFMYLWIAIQDLPISTLDLTNVVLDKPEYVKSIEGRLDEVLIAMESNYSIREIVGLSELIKNVNKSEIINQQFIKILHRNQKIHEAKKEFASLLLATGKDVIDMTEIDFLKESALNCYRLAHCEVFTFRSIFPISLFDHDKKKTQLDELECLFYKIIETSSEKNIENIMFNRFHDKFMNAKYCDLSKASIFCSAIQSLMVRKSDGTYHFALHNNDDQRTFNIFLLGAAKINGLTDLNHVQTTHLLQYVLLKCLKEKLRTRPSTARLSFTPKAIEEDEMVLRKILHDDLPLLTTKDVLTGNKTSEISGLFQLVMAWKAKEPSKSEFNEWKELFQSVNRVMGGLDQSITNKYLQPVFNV